MMIQVAVERRWSTDCAYADLVVLSRLPPFPRPARSPLRVQFIW